MTIEINDRKDLVSLSHVLRWRIAVKQDRWSIDTITPKTTRWFKTMTLWYLGWESGLFFKNLRKQFPSILSLQNPATPKEYVWYIFSSLFFSSQIKSCLNFILNFKLISINFKIQNSLLLFFNYRINEK